MKAFYSISIFIFATITYLIFYSSIDYNVNTPNYKVRRLINELSPQGWGFFTKSPREEMTDMYRVENGKAYKCLFENAHYTNLFGLSRKARKLGMEVAIIEEEIPDSSWVKTEGIANFEIPQQTIAIHGKYLHYFNTGEYVLVKRSIIPWAWYNTANPNKVPCKVAKVKIY